MSAIKPFNKLGVIPTILSALNELGYESPTAVQTQSIPALLAGHDLLAQAQTGTGKTAAFAIPILSQLDLHSKKPQALIITPTRELAIQVAEAFQSYAKHLKNFHVAPIYGGQDYQIQLRALKRGSHVIVGTPGRVMDHLRRRSLSIDALKTVVLDEADEMLKMGFIDNIEWILEQIPHKHQTALFSATMPASIQKIANQYLKDAIKIHIKPKERAAHAIEQSYISMNKNQKLDVLTRILEVEDIQATIIFARTKNSSTELAEKLQARGFAAAALNGDMNQSLREKVITRFKNGLLDMIVATDVAARGIDVDRISHVINFDIPCDTESYIHRIGRTGRAGRKGKALLFVTPREHRLFNDIKLALNTQIHRIEPPSLKEMRAKRYQQVTEKVISTLTQQNLLQPQYEMIENLLQMTNCTAKEIAAALAYLVEQANPLPTHEIEVPKASSKKSQQKRPFSRRKSSQRKPRKKRHSPR